MNELAQDPQLHKHIVVRSYLYHFAEKYKCHIDKIMVGMVGGDLHVWKYDEGAANVFTQLEIISNFESDDDFSESYGKTNAFEDFATLYEAVYTNPKLLKQKANKSPIFRAKLLILLEVFINQNGHLDEQGHFESLYKILAPYFPSNIKESIQSKKAQQPTKVSS